MKVLMLLSTLVMAMTSIVIMLVMIVTCARDHDNGSRVAGTMMCSWQ